MKFFLWQNVVNNELLLLLLLLKKPHWIALKMSIRWSTAKATKKNNMILTLRLSIYAEKCKSLTLENTNFSTVGSHLAILAFIHFHKNALPTIRQKRESTTLKWKSFERSRDSVLLWIYINIQIALRLETE